MNTIYTQLGGTRFAVMTGACNLVGSDKDLSFKVPSCMCKNKATHVRIRLEEPTDTYTVEFLRFSPRALSFTTISKHEGIQAHALQTLFTEQTGLDTHL